MVVPAWAGPQVTAQAALLMNSENGQILFEKNSRNRMYPASTTKMLTAIIALERGNLTDVVIVPPGVSGVEGSSIGLQEGERLSLEDLLYALMLNSGNDSALAIAHHIGGSVEGFVQLMNQKAQELGAADSHFANPNGLPDDNHYTSAYDLALIARYAMQNPVFRNIVQTKTKTIRRDNPDAQTYLLNHNKLLWTYNGAEGIKTGYTTQANQCIAASARRFEGSLQKMLPGAGFVGGKDRELIAVVLGSEGSNVWADAESLLNYGFDNFIPALLADAGYFITAAPVRFGEGDALLQTGSSFTYDFPKDGYNVIRQEVVLQDGVKAPVAAGQKLGDLVFFAGDRELGRVGLVAQQSVKRKLVAQWWFYPAVASLLYVLLRIVARRRNRLRRKRWEEYRRQKWPVR